MQKVPAVHKKSQQRPRLSRLDFMSPSFGCSDGYGNSAEEMCLAIERAGVPVRVVGMLRETGLVESRHLINPHGVPEGDAIVFYSKPVNWLKQMGRKGIGFTMTETDLIPIEWNIGLGKVEEIWVPSKWNLEVFSERCEKPVYHIPLAVNAKRFPYKRRERGQILNFLHFCADGSDRRKGVDLAIRAFKDAFPDRDDVRLTLRSTKFYYCAIDDPRINVEFGIIRPDALLDLYSRMDCLIYPSRGEGFGLIPLESMSSGLPAIFANASGMADYADYGLTVPAKKVPAPKPYIGSWFEPNMDAIVKRLQEVDQNYESIMETAELDSAMIQETWNYEKTAKAILARLNS